MRIAVTGKQGQVVSALIEVGPKLGVEIFPVGRPELDLLSPETVQPAPTNIRPDIIVNAAAYTAVDQAEKEPEVAMAVNAGGAMAVADAARTLACPWFISPRITHWYMACGAEQTEEEWNTRPRRVAFLSYTSQELI